jgi:hypothetical protein
MSRVPFFIGLDVSLAKTAVCVVDHEGAVQWQGKVPSEPCQSALKFDP